MYKYKNEAAFSKALVKALRAKYWFVQRIETGSIGRGVPDIYAISPLGDPVWLELKRVHTEALNRPYVRIPWREGQQIWLHEVAKVYKQHCYTLAAFDDCILQIPHNIELHKNDYISVKKCGRYFSIGELLC